MYYDPVDFEIADRVGKVAAKLGISRAKVGLAWILQKPGVTSPIVGATKLQHLEDLAGALEVKLAEKDMAYLEEPYRPKRTLGFS